MSIHPAARRDDRARGGNRAAGNSCDPNPDAQKALDQPNEKSRKMKCSERLAYQRKTLEEMLRKYPGEMVVERRVQGSRRCG